MAPVQVNTAAGGLEAYRPLEFLSKCRRRRTASRSRSVIFNLLPGQSYKVLSLEAQHRQHHPARLLYLYIIAASAVGDRMKVMLDVSRIAAGTGPGLSDLPLQKKPARSGARGNGTATAMRLPGLGAPVRFIRAQPPLPSALTVDPSGGETATRRARCPLYLRLKFLQLQNASPFVNFFVEIFLFSSKIISIFFLNRKKKEKKNWSESWSESRVVTEL